MPLPREGSAWPPREWAPAFDRYRLDEAIWLNDTEKLRTLLQGGAVSTQEGRTLAMQRKNGGVVIDLLRRWGWGRSVPTGERRTDLPVPIGANIAALSAAQLMSEAPMVRLLDSEGNVRRARRTRDGATIIDETQARLDVIANSDDAHMTLLEGAQTVAAIGGGVLVARWDTTDPDRESVWFDVVGADCAIPEFNSTGRLLGVILWQEYPARGDKIYRHLQRHAVDAFGQVSAGVIEHALYLGTPTSIGKLVPLSAVDELGDLLNTPRAELNGTVLTLRTGLSRPTAQFWRNLPARAHRRSGQLANLGRSDFELIEPLLDAYSEAWASMMRDVRLGKARLLVPVGMLERAGTSVGSGGVFDPDREMYQEVGGFNPEAGTDSIKDHQALIRWEEHLRVLAGLKAEILDGAGWSLASYGAPSVSDSGGSVTATEVVDRTTKSERTRDAKGLMFKQPANPFFRMLFELDGILYPGGGGGPITDELSIDFPDVSQVDPEKQARTFLDLSSARAISIEQTVRERRPNWDEDDVAAEVARILEDMDRLSGGLADPARIERVELTDPATAPEPPPSRSDPAPEPEPANA